MAAPGMQAAGAPAGAAARRRPCPPAAAAQHRRHTAATMEGGGHLGGMLLALPATSPALLPACCQRPPGGAHRRRLLRRVAAGVHRLGRGGGVGCHHDAGVAAGAGGGRHTLVQWVDRQRRASRGGLRWRPSSLPCPQQLLGSGAGALTGRARPAAPCAASACRRTPCGDGGRAQDADTHRRSRQQCTPAVAQRKGQPDTRCGRGGRRHSRAPQDVGNHVGQLRQLLQRVVAADAGRQLQRAGRQGGAVSWRLQGRACCRAPADAGQPLKLGSWEAHPADAGQVLGSNHGACRVGGLHSHGGTWAESGRQPHPTELSRLAALVPAAGRPHPAAGHPPMMQLSHLLQQRRRGGRGGRW